MRTRGTFIANRMPYDPENKTLSKSAFVAKMRAIKEREAQLKAYEEKLKSESLSEPQVAPVVAEPAKKPGRPKKSE